MLTKLVYTLAGLALLLVVLGQLGLLKGRAPQNLGPREGRLKPPSKTPNSVHSQASAWADHPQRDYAAIEPLQAGRDAPAAMARIHAIVQAMPGAEVVEQRADYLYVQFTTRWLKFVDDCEFWFDPASGLVQVRSASRIGRKDFDVNRARIEAIRRRLAQG